jgi:pilus assembly protein Flp/PilA
MPNTHLQRRQRREERGASLVEYALLLALIAVACVVAVSLLGGNLNNSYSKDASSVAATPG